jgi:hypothetical protein
MIDDWPSWVSAFVDAAVYRVVDNFMQSASGYDRGKDLDVFLFGHVHGLIVEFSGVKYLQFIFAHGNSPVQR